MYLEAWSKDFSLTAIIEPIKKPGAKLCNSSLIRLGLIKIYSKINTTKTVSLFIGYYDRFMGKYDIYKIKYFKILKMTFS